MFKEIETIKKKRYVNYYIVRKNMMSVIRNTQMEWEMNKKWLFLFLKKILFIYQQKEREEEREGEKCQCVVASRVPPTRDLTFNLGMCPDWESKQ